MTDEIIVICTGPNQTGPEEVLIVELPLQLGKGETLDMYESLGFTLVEQTTKTSGRWRLPRGWQYVPIKQAGLVYIVDSKGRFRVDVLTGTAEPRMYLERRFRPNWQYADEDDDPDTGEWDRPVQAIVRDQNIAGLAWQSEPLTRATLGLEEWELHDEVISTAARWLDEHYPDWRDPLAYWEDA